MDMMKCVAHRATMTLDEAKAEDKTKYINANDFREYLLSLKKDVPAGVKAYITGQSISDLLEDFPAADVKEVKHGRWRKIYGQPHLMECSVCGSTSVKGKLNYCPNCGAKMDEVTE